MKHSNSKIGSQKFILSDVDSTNNFAAKLINDGIGGHGSVIMAENQSNGRGQQGSLWQSDPNLNLLCSIVLSSKALSKINPIRINWYVSICIIDFLKRKDIIAQIKWPNDILVHENKISGILIENKFVGSSFKNSIIGVGINVNQSEFNGLSATSMFLQSNINYSIIQLLDDFIFSLNQNEQYMFLKQDDQLKKRYLNSLFGLGEERHFSSASGTFKGKIVDVDEVGRLIVEYNGQKCLFQNKEIKFL